MAELLIYSSELLQARLGNYDADASDVRALSEGLKAAIPDCEPRVDDRVFLKIGSLPRQSHLTATGMWFDVIGVVLPAATTALVKATVDVAVDRLRGFVKHRLDRKFVLIYGPDGEQLSMVRLRGGEEPEVIEAPWPGLEKFNEH
jgi:hypothetical protein